MTLFGKPMHWWVLGALVLGVALGVLLHMGLDAAAWNSMGVADSSAFLKRTASEANANAGFAANSTRFALESAKFVGDLFLRLLRMLAVPIVLFSIIAAVAGVGDPKTLGRMGARTLGVFSLTACCAVVLAGAMTLLVKPGTFLDASVRDKIAADFAGEAAKRITTNKEFASSNTIWSQLLDAFPANPFKALADGNMLQVVVFSVLVGLGVLFAQHHAKDKVTHFFEALADACLRLVGLVMKLAPLAVFCLTALLVSQLGLSVLKALSVFVLVVLAGLAIINFLQYPLVIKLLGQRGRTISIREYFKAMTPAQLLAFSSSSSAATMPVTMECCDAMRVPRKVSGFVVPLGTTINMDGTAFYQVMCVTFLAQAFGIALSASDLVGISLMAIIVAIGSPGLPGASLVLMVFILDAFKIPASGLALIIAVDRVLDMARTVVNVSGDAAASVVVASWERESPRDERTSAT
jgi:proton glutamate symport protein